MKIKLNRECPLYSHLKTHGHFTDAEIKPILSLFTSRRVRKHQYVLQEGDISSRDIFVVRGVLRKYSLEDDKEWISQFATEGNWITDHESQLHRTPSAFFIDALEESRILTIEAHDVAVLMKESSKFVAYYLNEMRKAMVVQERRARYMQLHSANKYASFVASFGYLQDRVSQTHIASFIGISRESLSRIRSNQLKMQRMCCERTGHFAPC